MPSLKHVQGINKFNKKMCSEHMNIRCDLIFFRKETNLELTALQCQGFPDPGLSWEDQWPTPASLPLSRYPQTGSFCTVYDSNQ